MKNRTFKSVTMSVSRLAVSCWLAAALLSIPPAESSLNLPRRNQDKFSSFSNLNSRWRRSPSPIPSDPDLQWEQVENIHKPNIQNCQHKPSIKEEQPIDTEVMQVQAVDLDSNATGAGQILFSIVSTNKKFNINPSTGVITTNKIFNRDEPDREKVDYVTVKASDRGNPSLEDVCTITVIIEDINDNAPIFDRASYEIPLAQDTDAGAEIMRLSATDIDEGVNQNITYEIRPLTYPTDIDYFRIDKITGVVTLAKALDKPQGSVFLLQAIARDQGFPQQEATTDITVDVKESNNKPPIFRENPNTVIELSEMYKDFNTPIASFVAESQIPGDPTVFFELNIGRTEQTNSGSTFRALPDEKNDQKVNIYLSKPLEYEKEQSYILTLKVGNRENLVSEVQLTIRVKDENNKVPVFVNIEPGAVLEHEPVGTVVMSVTAVDGDGTYPNNRVKFRISDKDKDLMDMFAINEDTGVITTRVEFDREEKSYYALEVIAEDGAPSAILNNGAPNRTPYRFKIVIKDKNDNPPYFPKQMYRPEVPEDADIGSKVIEVRAKDEDKEASVISYSIKNGNLDLAFKIEEKTGIIRVAKELDYEKIKEYTLIVQAYDGAFSNDTTVHIDVLNVNDMRPEFEEQEYRATIKENDVPSGAILRVVAWDPDIEDRTAPQNITYFLDKTNDFADHFSIDNQGYFRVVKALDRDPPEGSPTYHIFVFAKDENGGPKGREHFVECIITLEDVNDNAPTLDMPDGLVWYENTSPGDVGELFATDKDTDANGPPFTFGIDPQASADFKSKFDVKSQGGGKYVLVTKKFFDREAQKTYSVPIRIADNQGKAGISLLTLIIGDKNDNDMAPGIYYQHYPIQINIRRIRTGSSEIFVYNYEGRAPTTKIGRVFVDDPDDWDLPDKTFRFKDASRYPDFSLDPNTGIISMKEGIKLDEEIKTYHMEFEVDDVSRGQRAVPANVTVTVKKISAEAVKKSGSIRIDVPPEKFLSGGSLSADGRQQLTKLLRGYLNASVVDVFTLLPADLPDKKGTDVRFSAHGSPYYAPERMELSVARRKTDLERQMDFNIVMINIDECLIERSLSDKAGAKCDGACYNKLEIENQPTAVMTNRKIKTTFVGVTALTEARCGCPAPPRQSCDLDSSSSSNLWRSAYSLEQQQVCLEGSCTVTGKCQCAIDQPQVYGPFCEKRSASIRYGWTTHQGINSCGNTTIRLRFTTKQSRGLLLYQGPSPNTVVQGVTDFVALEIHEGKLKYYLNYGRETSTAILQKIVSDGVEHSVEFSWSNSTVHLILDNGDCLPSIQDCQLQASRPRGKAQYMNSNGPLQVGGLYFGKDRLRDLAAELKVARETLPAGDSFAGCLRDLQVSENDGSPLWISLGTPADGEQYQDGCSMEYVLAVEATGMNLNFLLIILAILAIILTAMCVLTVYRRRRVPYSDKDIDCDIRENIINYDDEGGGEGDGTGYDLSVLRLRSAGTTQVQENGYGHMTLNGQYLPPAVDKQQQQQQQELPGVGHFLDETKDKVDQDPEATPYDDLRHYAYEGDGNSGTGSSLSSLNSGSEADQDLEFEYLHNFGPRFKKLADMYGRETETDSSSSETGENNLGYHDYHDHVVQQHQQPGSESWC